MANDRSEPEGPYEPRYKGFDAERTRHAQRTAERALEGAGARGEDANESYVDDGPREAARRRGESEEEVGAAVERAAKRRAEGSGKETGTDPGA